MRRIAIALLTLSTLACKPPDKAPPDKTRVEAERAPARAEPEPEPLTKPGASEPQGSSTARPELVAKDLPTPPALGSIAVEELASGEFGFPDGTDELAPRTALALDGGLLLAGQAYHERRLHKPPRSWRWTGFVPTEGEPRSTRLAPGGIRAGTLVDGGGLLAGTRGLGFDARGWLATVDREGRIEAEVELLNPSATELFTVLPGRPSSEGELALVGGYVDAQGWVASLDSQGEQRWEKYVGSYGYTQIRELARLDGGDLLAVGTRSKKFGQAWAAQIPGDGGANPAPDDVEQHELDIIGADPNRLVHAIVDLGEAGYLALGTAKRNFIQDHDQVFVLGFDRAGKITWSSVVPELRVVEVLGAETHADAAVFVVTAASREGLSTLALLRVRPGQPALARSLVDGQGWTSAGFVAGSAKPELVAFSPSEAGIRWRRVALPNIR